MRPRGVAGDAVVLRFGHVVASGITPRCAQRETGERLAIIRNEHPDQHTEVIDKARRQDSRGVDCGCGLLQDLFGPSGVSVLHQIQTRSKGMVCGNLRRKGNGPPQGALGVRVSTQQTVGFAEFNEE